MTNSEEYRVSKLSDIYTTEETEKLLIKGIALKKISQKFTLLFAGSLLTGVAISLLLLNLIEMFFLFYLVPLALGIAGACLCLKKMDLFKKFYLNTMIPYLYQRAGVVRFGHVKDRNVIEKLRNSPLSSLHGGWDTASCSANLSFDLNNPIATVKDLSLRKISLYKKEKSDDGKSTRTRCIFRGLVYHIPVDIGLKGDLTITYEDTAIERMVESTGRAMFRQKKVFNFNNAILERFFDCTVVPHGSTMSGVIDRGIGAVMSRLSNEQADKYNSQEAYEEAHLQAQSFVSSAMEEFLMFLFEAYGPYNLAIRKSGIYFEIIDYKSNILSENLGLLALLPIPAGMMSLGEGFLKLCGFGRKKAKGIGNNYENFLDYGVFKDNLKFAHMNDNFEVFNLTNLLLKYLRNPEDQRNYSASVSDDFDYFDSVRDMKALKPKELNKEYEDFYAILKEKVAQEEEIKRESKKQ